MGKHEKPSEKSFLDKACEVEDAIKALEPSGIIGFTGMGIQLYSKVFKEVFTEYRAVPTTGGYYLHAEHGGHMFIAYEREAENETLSDA